MMKLYIPELCLWSGRLPFMAGVMVPPDEHPSCSTRLCKYLKEEEVNDRNITAHPIRVEACLHDPNPIHSSLPRVLALLTKQA